MKTLLALVSVLLLLFGGVASQEMTRAPIQTGNTQQTAANPGPRQAHLLIYDEHLRKVILPTLKELWSWNGRHWELLPGSGPRLRTLSSAAYDTRRKRIVLYGGRTVPNQEVKGDTWEWDNKSWQQVSNTSGGTRDHPAMVYDVARSKTVLFSGGGDSSNHSGPWDNSTWEWDGIRWTQAAAEGPSGRISSLVYDSKRKQVVLFGGAGDGPSPQTRPYHHDTWVWDGKHWRKVSEEGPAGRYAHSLAFDRRAGVVLLYGGFKWREQLEDMWQWDGQHWTEIKLTPPTPGKRSAAAMVYDARRGRVVLHGGQLDRQILDDTREWDGRRWQRMN